MARPYIKPRSQRPFVHLDNALKTMIEAHVGKPCPTTESVVAWTGMPRRRVWPYLEEMQSRGLIEIEVIEYNEVGKDPKRRRLRIVGGDWTDWTSRAGRDGIFVARRPKYDSEGNIMNIDENALKGYIAEIEASRLRQKGETQLQQEIFRKAKGSQLDPKAMRIVLQRRSMGDERRDEQDYYIHAYEMALGGKKAAMDALAAGATQREAAAAGGISEREAGRLAKLGA